MKRLVLPLILAMAGPAGAAHVDSWDGRWTGAWGGYNATAVVVADGRVVSYEYGGQTKPVTKSRVTPQQIIYEGLNSVVTMTRTGPNTAHATIHTFMGDGTAELERR